MILEGIHAAQTSDRLLVEFDRLGAFGTGIVGVVERLEFGYESLSDVDVIGLGHGNLCQMSWLGGKNGLSE